MDNRTIARRLLALAHTLEERRANFHRVKAYRRAAETVLGLDRPVEDLLAGAGRCELQKLPGIGGSLSEKIERLVRIGDIATLDMDEASTARGPRHAESHELSRSCKRCDDSSK